MKTNAVHEEHKLKYETLDEELAQFKERKFDLLQMLFHHPSEKHGIEFYKNLLGFTLISFLVFIVLLLVL